MHGLPWHWQDLSLAGCATLDQSLSLSVPPRPHLRTGRNVPAQGDRAGGLRTPGWSREVWAAETPTWVGVHPVGIQSIRSRLPGGLGGHRAVAVDAQGGGDRRDGRGSDGRRGAGSWEEKATDGAEEPTHTHMQTDGRPVSESAG